MAGTHAGQVNRPSPWPWLVPVAALVAGTANIGSEAIHLENWRSGFQPSFKQDQISDITFPDAALVKVALAPVPSEIIEANLAALREPEGPPPPPLTVETFPLLHLWFLYVLLIFCAAALLLRAVVHLIDRSGAPVQLVQA